MRKIKNEGIYVIKMTENSWLGNDDLEYIEVFNLSAAERYIGYQKAKEVFENISMLAIGEYDNIELQKIGLDIVEFSITDLEQNEIDDMIFKGHWDQDVFSKRKENMTDKWISFCKQIKAQL